MVDCHYCGKQGHIQAMFRSKRAGAGSDMQRQNHHTVAEESSEEEPDTLHDVNSSANEPIVVELLIDDRPVRMEVDTGASQTVIGETMYQELWSRDKPKLRPSKANLLTYTGEELQLAGELSVKVRYKEEEVQETLLVVQGSGPSFARKGLAHEIRLNWANLNSLRMCWNG